MSQKTTLEVKGLYTNPNELTLPDGALLKADNIVIDRPNILQSRRGMESLPITEDFNIPGDTLNSFFEYMDTFIAHSDNIFGDFPGLVSYYNKDLSQWNQIGDGLLKPAGRRPRFTEAGGSTFMTTNNGVYKIDTLPTSPYIAGGIKALSGSASFPGIGTGVAVPNNTQVAYRVLWGYKDAQDRTIFGVPSQRIILINNSGLTKNGIVNFFIPKTVTSADFYQVYRSGASASVTDPPDDNMGLVYEGNATNVDLDNGFIQITDITPDALIGPALYTNPNQTDNGIADANEPPPMANDITQFKGSVFYANTVGVSRVTLTLLTAVQFQKLTIASASLVEANFTGGASETGTSPDFTYKVFTTGTPSENIANTAISLVNQVNKLGPDYPITAYYISGPNELPGKILFECTILNDPENEFMFYVDSAPNIWNPPLPLFVPMVRDGGEETPSWTRTSNVVTFTTNNPGSLINFAIGQEVWVEAYPGQEPPASDPDSNFPYGMKIITSIDFDTSFTYNEVGPDASSTSRPGVRNRPLDSVKTKADIYKNGIYFSKFQEYEAVPLGQLLFAGSDTEEILRIAPLRDSLIILKTDGVYRLTGTDASNFALYTLDTSVRLIAPDSVQVIQNQVVAYTNQGIVAITDSGVTIISSPIEQTLLDLIGMVGEEVIARTSFGVSYETDHRYLIHLPTSSTDTQATQAFAYNIFTQTWTRWIMSKCFGLVSKENDKLYLGTNLVRDDSDTVISPTFVSEERKNYNYTDFADESDTVQILNEIGTFTNQLEFSNINDFNKVQVGDTIYLSPSSWGIIVIKDLTTNMITLDKVIEINGDAPLATRYKGIHCIVNWAPLVAQSARDGGGPAESKDFTEIQFYARRSTVRCLNVLIANEQSQSYLYVPKQTGSLGLWGMFNWGDTWDMKPRIQNFRLAIPIDLQVCAFLYLGLDWYSTWSYFDYEGMSVKTELKAGSRSTAK